MADQIPPPKTRQQWEVRLVSEYIAKNYPDDRSITNVAVGAINPRITESDLSEREIRQLGVSRPRADCVIFRETEIVLIEGWITHPLNKPAKLAAYKLVLPSTPEFNGLTDKPINAFMLGPFEDALARRIATELGLGFRIYTPNWIHIAFEAKEPRHRTDRFRDFLFVP